MHLAVVPCLGRVQEADGKEDHLELLLLAAEVASKGNDAGGDHNTNSCASDSIKADGLLGSSPPFGCSPPLGSSLGTVHQASPPLHHAGARLAAAWEAEQLALGMRAADLGSSGPNLIKVEQLSFQRTSDVSAAAREGSQHGSVAAGQLLAAFKISGEPDNTHPAGGQAFVTDQEVMGGQGMGCSHMGMFMHLATGAAAASNAVPGVPVGCDPRNGAMAVKLRSDSGMADESEAVAWPQQQLELQQQVQALQEQMRALQQQVQAGQAAFAQQQAEMQQQAELIRDLRARVHGSEVEVAMSG